MPSKLLIPFLFFFAAVSVCMAENRAPSRGTPICNVPTVDAETTNRLPREEYASINETVNTANQLFSEGNIKEAGKLCNLAYLKYEFYEKQLIADKSKNKCVDAVAVSVDTINGDKAKQDMLSGENKMKSPAANSAETGIDKKMDERLSNLKVQENISELPVESTSQRIIGRKTVYIVKKHESLRMIGAKLGINWQLIARENGLDPSKRLEPGKKLIVDTRRIVPKFVRNGIVINIPDRTLYYFRNNQLAEALPVGLGMKESHDKTFWQTPTGKFSIVCKLKDPVWHIPPSIQSEMKRKGKTVKTSIPPGNNNPLGKYSLKTSLPGIMIHSTIFPESIYGFKSHGCIRMLPKNMETFFNEIKVKTNGEIIYQPVKLAVSDDGRIFIEVHGDVYSKYKNLEGEVKRLIELNNAVYKVDWDKIKASLKLKSGIAEDITLARYSQNISP